MPEAFDISNSVSRLKKIAPAGFAMAIHIRFTTPTFLLQSYPKDWIALYSQKGLVMQDPTVHWGFENVGLIDWSELRAQDAANVIPQAAEHGLKFGVTYAVNRGESLSVTSFARSDRTFNDAERAEIETVVNAIHDATLKSDTLPPEIIDALKAMSITATLAGA